MKSKSGVLYIGSQNVQGGLERKVQFNDFVQLVNQKDIFCLQETWLTETSAMCIPGYSIFRSERKNNRRKNSGSGGVAVLFKTSISKGLQKICSSNNDFLWVKLNRNYFGLKQDLYLCNCYIPPYGSSFHENITQSYFDTLNEEVVKFSKLGDIMLCGDFNARIGNIQEHFVEHDENIQQNMIGSSDIELPVRYNEDQVINGFGKKLIEFLEEANMMLVNGRKLGDSMGNKTCYNYMGSSTIDYCIVSHSMFHEIVNFEVDNQTWYSDHSPLNITLKIDRNFDRLKMDCTGLSNIKKFCINEQNLQCYTAMLNSEDVHDRLTNLIECDYIDPNCLLSDFKDIVLSVANETFPIKICKNNIIESPLREELGKEYKPLGEAKRKFNSARKAMYREKGNFNRRHTFIIARREYKKIKYLIFNKNKMNNLVKLAKIQASDPGKFWKTVKKITSTRPAVSGQIGPQTWVHYFKDLLNVKSDRNSQFLEYIKHSLKVVENNLGQEGPIDNIITMAELEKVLKGVKNKKSPGPDMITNEMLKAGDGHFRQAMLFVFNAILKSGKYPTVWQNSLITPVFKSGDNEDPQNYRGVALADCLSKIFCKIINDRITKFFEEKKLWSFNQNGFKEGARTEDNIFALQTLFEKYVKKGKKRLYVAYIDFRKFFDSINREALYYKLIKSGITGRVYEILKSAYENCCFRVKTPMGLTGSFLSTTGVKQGCVLSPTLSNIFQNDLHQIFDNECFPVSLGDIVFNSMSWADDLILVSEAKEGLQNCLNKLQMYCDKWGVSINVSKSKCMVMSSGCVTSSNFNFVIGDEKLETVSTYKYLGLVVSNNGKLHNMIGDRVKKAKRAIFLVRKALSTGTNVSTDLAMTIFDKRIDPILTYGCPIWGSPICKNIVKLKFDNIPTDQIKHFVCEKLKLLDVFLRYDDVNVIRTMREASQIFVSIKDPVSMFRILSNYSKYPLSFEVTESVSHDNLAYEIVHTNFCKFALGVSKYFSSTLSMGELGRYPLEYKVIRLCIMYWFRLNDGNVNTLVRNAYNECKSSNHEWYQQIKYFLLKNGLGHIIVNSDNEGLNALYVKQKLIQRLQDQHRQYYSSFIAENCTQGKTNILNICKQKDYGEQWYLFNVVSPSIRQKITRLRIDANNLNDCLFRNPRFYKSKATHNGMCGHCKNLQETVEHRLLHCSNPDFVNVREEFYNNCEKYVGNFKLRDKDFKLRWILNPNIKDNASKNDVLVVICNFIKRIYP